MNLRDLVGRMAIRTDKVREVMPWEMERAFRLDFMVPVPTFDREKYMDEPVRILAVEGTQVVIEEDGKRKPLDGVYAETKGTYTKFKGTGAFQKEKRILHQKVADVGIKASLQTGMVSINDRNRNQAIAVSITEMVAVLNEALRYGTAGMGKKVRL